MNATFRTTRYNISFKIFAHASTTKSTTKLHRVAKRVQHHTTSRKTRDVVSYNICLVKKFDRNQTSYNTIQQGGQASATFHTTSKLYDVV